MENILDGKLAIITTPEQGVRQGNTLLALSFALYSKQINFILSK